MHRSAFFPRFTLKAPPFGMSIGRFRSFSGERAAGLDLRGKASTWLRPQRGRTTRIIVLLCDIFEVVPCIVTPTAGQDLRGKAYLHGYDPKGSHNKNNRAIVRHLRSRPLHSYTHRRSRPAVSIVRPLWGLNAEVLVPSATSCAAPPSNVK